MTGLISSFFLILTEHFPTILAQGNYDSEGSLRVAGGKGANEGRIEIYHEGTWGTVCFTEWDMVDGLIACRQLGYPGIEMVGPANGQGTGKIWLNRVRCIGTEKRLDECFGNWGINDCDHGDDAGVRCALFPEGNRTVRLVGGETDDEGRIELFHNNEWGTVCDDEFDINDGEVACRQLGYPGVHSVHSGAAFGPGYGSIWLDDMQCSGAELALTDCLHGGSDHDCAHTEDAGVRCLTRSEAHASTVRLVDGPSDNVGRLEIYHDSQWGTVCDDGWDAMDTRVVCQQLEFTGMGAYFMAADRGYGLKESRLIFLDTVECIGDERGLEFCPHDGWGVNDCQHSEDVGIECYGSGRSVGVMVGIGVGCLMGVLLLCLCCCWKCNKRTPSQHRAVPTEDVPSAGAVPLGDIHVSGEGTPAQNNIQPAVDAVGLPPPSYDEIRHYRSVGLEGTSPSADHPNHSPYPSPSAPYPQTHLPPPAPHPQPSAPYPLPLGASGTYYYPAADSGVVLSSPLESHPTNAPYPTRNCTSV